MSTCSSNFWRSGYERPSCAWLEAVPEHSPRWAERKKRSTNRQKDQQRRTGFAGEHAELSHEVVAELRKMARWTQSDIWLGGQLVCSGGVWNFEGNRKLAELAGKSIRTIQRARAKLEAAGLITSYRLEPGDRVAGMKRAARRHQVVRNVEGLIKLARVSSRLTPRRGKKRRATAGSKTVPPRGAPAVVCVAPPVVDTPWGDLAQRDPAWLADACGPRFAAAVAMSSQSPPPPEPAPRTEKRPPPPLNLDEVEHWEVETERLERGEPRGPPVTP